MNNTRLLTISATAVFGVLLLFSIIKKTEVVAPPKPEHPQIQPIPPFQTPPSPPKTYTFQEAMDEIKESEIKEILYKLASDEWEGRMSGKQGNREAASYIEQYFRDCGLQTEYDRFSISRVNPGPKNETGDDFTQNIYGYIEGPIKDQVIVVGAHMDHIGYGPRMSRSSRIDIHHGADDNASGTAALMVIAKAFSKIKDKVKRTIVFQAYSAEEMGLIGSRHYCDNPTFPKNNPDIRDHIFMLNMDMVGRLNGGVYNVAFYSGNSSVDISTLIGELDRKHLYNSQRFASRITSRVSGGSDHACFYNKRVPIAFLHTGSHRDYHTPDDTPDKINYSGMEAIAKYAFEFVWRVDQESTAPQFNYGEFKEMPYTHDHGHGVPFYHPYHKHNHQGE